MNIHEYQTKELLRGYGVAVPDGRVTHNVDNAVAIAEDLGGERWVVKAQIHAAGVAREAASRWRHPWMKSGSTPMR